MHPPLTRLPDSIDTLLLDLDGTLLDLAYDTHFWLELMPAHYGAARGLTPQQALDEILPRMRASEGTLPWYCLDHWSEVLGMDLAALKRRFPERIGWLPGAREFLARQRAAGRRLVLATNSHPVTLGIKDERTGLSRHFDAVHSSHEFGVPKEDPRFWERFRAAVDYDPARTAFIDDNLAVLRAARGAGIACLIAITDPDSSRPARPPYAEFESVPSVAML
jgi:5'-nucleotidase